MDRARSHTPVVYTQERLFLFGGGGPQFASLSSAAAFDPQTQRWESLRDMPTKRSGTVACVVDGRVFVIGGGFKQPDGMFRFLPTVEIYDPKSDTWETGPDMLQPHDYPGGALMGDHIYILGGHHPDATRSGPKTDPGFAFCERLDLRSGRWEEIAPLPTPRFALTGAVYEGNLLAMGGVAFTPDGFNNFDLIERYDPGTNSWSLARDIALPWPAAGQATCVFRERLCTFGGYSGDGIHPRAAWFDARQRAWQRLPDLPAPRAATGIAVAQTQVYLFGGWADDGRTPMDSVFALDLDGVVS
jgi:N-acetylneuraminic acid mutarotase